jgi:hypothetical protein
MAHPLDEELAGVKRALENNSQAMTREAFRGLNESHSWTDDDFRAFRDALNATSEDFIRLLERKRHLERQIRASQTP